jgi:hypothetical protein
MRIFSCLILIVVFISGCSKESNTLDCNNYSVKSQLLSQLESSDSVQYYSNNITNVTTASKSNESRLCYANINFQSNLDNKIKLSIPVKYSLYVTKSLFQNSISDLSFAPSDKIKLDNWINTVNAMAQLLGDYQSTPYGAIYVMNESNLQYLYFNGSEIEPEVANNSIKIEKEFITDNDNYIYLIGSYTGGAIDADTRNNFLIDIESNGTYKMTRMFAYQPNKINLVGESILIYGYNPGRPYAESTDFPIYEYSYGDLAVIQDVKPESYYLNKFSTLKPIDIINQAKKELCYDNNKNLLDTSLGCKYGIKYCFEFKAIAESSNTDDINYKILKQSCN